MTFLGKDTVAQVVPFALNTNPHLTMARIASQNAGQDGPSYKMRWPGTKPLALLTHSSSYYLPQPLPKPKWNRATAFSPEILMEQSPRTQTAQKQNSWCTFPLAKKQTLNVGRWSTLKANRGHFQWMDFLFSLSTKKPLLRPYPSNGASPPRNTPPQSWEPSQDQERVSGLLAMVIKFKNTCLVQACLFCFFSLLNYKIIIQFEKPLPKEKIQWQNFKGPLQSLLHVITFTKWYITLFVRYDILNFPIKADFFLQGEDWESGAGKWWAVGEQKQDLSHRS